MHVDLNEVEEELKELVDMGTSLGDSLRILHHERGRGRMFLWPAVMRIRQMTKQDAMLTVVRETSSTRILSRVKPPAKLLAFEEAFSRDITFGAGTRAAVAGYLVVTFDFSYLLARRDNFASDLPQRSILISGRLVYDRIGDAGFLVSVGTMVLFSGRAQVTGRLSRTGLSLFPVAFTALENIDFVSDAGERYEIVVPDSDSV